MNSFYIQTLQKLLTLGVIRKEDKILVTCAAWEDRDVLQALEFKNVVLSNLFQAEEKHYQPFAWSRQDAENLTYENNEFDFCIVHQGLHHCAAPHQALVEMYRVARTGVVAVEPIDNIMVRLSLRLGLAQEYEPDAVAGHDYRGGGWRNTIIPNHVYRWTRREVRKTINAYAPYAEHQFIFLQQWGVDHVLQRLSSRSKAASLAARLLRLPLGAVFKLGLNRVGNLFAFAALKPQIGAHLQPWLEFRGKDIGLRYEWFKQHGLPNPERSTGAAMDRGGFENMQVPTRAESATQEPSKPAFDI